MVNLTEVFQVSFLARPLSISDISNYRGADKSLARQGRKQATATVSRDKDLSAPLRSRYRGADKSLARPTSRCILFDGENISFDASLVIYINSTNFPPSMIMNGIYENQNILSL